MLWQMARFHLYYGWVVFHCVYTPHLIFIYSPVDGHLSCFYIMFIVSNATMNIGVHISFRIIVYIFFGWIARSGIAGSCGSSILNFLRNHHTVLHSVCTNLHSRKYYMSFPFFQHSHQHLFVVVFIIAILAGRRWYFIVVLIFVSLMISYVKHFFQVSCWPSVYLLWKRSEERRVRKECRSRWSPYH